MCNMGAWMDKSEASGSVEGGAIAAFLSKENLKGRFKFLKVWPLIIGIFLLLFAIALERVQLLETEPVQTGSEAAARSAEAPPRPAESFISYHTFIALLSELGVAFVIAWIVSMAIEAAARREQNESINEAREAIMRDVFEAAFRIRQDPDYVRSVIQTCLEQRLTREDYNIHYRISPFPPVQEHELGVDPGRFVKIGVGIRYRVRNGGSRREAFSIKYSIPTRAGVLREIAQVTGVRIGEKAMTGEGVKVFEAKASDLKHDTTLDGDRLYSFEVDLGPMESIEIQIDAVLVKEMSDSDTFGFSQPTKGATIMIHNSVPDLRFGVQARTGSAMRTVRSPDDGAVGEWRIDGPVLPYQSVNIWWRSPADDGEVPMKARPAQLQPDGGQAVISAE